MSNATKKNLLSPRHQQLARLLVGGYSQAEISRTLGMHKSTVSRLVKQPAIVAEVKRLQDMADVNTTTCVPGMPDKISEGATRSIQVLMDILNDERDEPAVLKVKALVAQDLLSRAGFGPVKQIDVRQSSISTQLSPEDLETFRKRGTEAMREAGFDLVTDKILAK